MGEILFDEEGIKFKYLSNWREQRKDVIDSTCIKALFRMDGGNPASINIYKKDTDAEFVANLENPMRRNFEMQGWEVVDSKILNLKGMPVFNIIANADECGKILEIQVMALLNDGNLYVFELINFKDFPYAYDDYLAILSSIEF